MQSESPIMLSNEYLSVCPAALPAGAFFACPHEGALYPACPIVDINELKMYGVEIRHTVGIGEQYLSAEHLAPPQNT